MLNNFFVVLDIGLLIAGGYFIYWHSKIDVRGGYATFQILFAGLIATLLVTGGENSLPYILFSAACITLVLMAGNSGLTPTRVIATGAFSKVIPYTKLSAITLTPLSLPNGRELVIAVFNLSPRRFVRLTFRIDLQSLLDVLRPRVPENVEIAIQHLQ